MVYAKYTEQSLKNEAFEDFLLKKDYTKYTCTGTTISILTLGCEEKEEEEEEKEFD
jgi:hypothetical protein